MQGPFPMSSSQRDAHSRGGPRQGGHGTQCTDATGMDDLRAAGSHHPIHVKLRPELFAHSASDTEKP